MYMVDYWSKGLHWIKHARKLLLFLPSKSHWESSSGPKVGEADLVEENAPGGDHL